MKEPTKEPVLDNPVKPSASNQRGFSVIELLFAASTIRRDDCSRSDDNPEPEDSQNRW